MLMAENVEHDGETGFKLEKVVGVGRMIREDRHLRRHGRQL